MGQELKFGVCGIPAPQGSLKSFIVPDKDGREDSKAIIRETGEPAQSIVTNSNSKTSPWKGEVRNAAILAMQEQNVTRIHGPVEIHLEFIMPRPKYHYRRNGTILPSAPIAPDTMPDGDKLERAIWDALTEAGLWDDDARVVKWSGLERWAVDRPGVLVHVKEYTLPSEGVAPGDYVHQHNLFAEE